MYKIPLEILYRLDEQITNLPSQGKLRRELIHEVAVRYQLSDSTIYRQLKLLMLHPNERAIRKDKGCPKIIKEEVIHHYCQLIAAMKIRSMNGKKHILSTKQCIKFLEEDGVKVKEQIFTAINVGNSTLHHQNCTVCRVCQTIPAPHSDLAQATLRNPYLFDFLSLGKDAHEREVEAALVAHIERFFLELGEGFAFLGRQYHLQVEDQDFYLDLLFYNIKLRSFLVVELKSGKFKPEYTGKMNFYLSAVDDLLRQPGDNPSIGLILCRSKVGVLAEYALRDMSKPIGLAEYRLTELLPKEIKTILPTIEELEVELSKDMKNGNGDA